MTGCSWGLWCPAKLQTEKRKTSDTEILKHLLKETSIYYTPLCLWSVTLLNFSFSFWNLSLTCIPAPGLTSLHLFHPGLIPGVGKVHQQHQLDQNETESSTRAHDKPCCRDRDTQVFQLLSTPYVMIWVSERIKYNVLTVGERPIWNVKGTGCHCHQDTKLKEPKSKKNK